MSSDAASPAPRRGQLFVVSAPSGTGKTTVVERLVQKVPDLALSRSYTSRAARSGETDGVDYNFITRARFEQMIADDAFLEWADVFGNLYGTGDTGFGAASGGGSRPRSCDRRPGRPPGADPLQRHGRHLRYCRHRSASSNNASADAARTPRRRCSDASRLPATRSRPSSSTDYVVVNDELEGCVGRLQAIMTAERARLRSVRPLAERIVETFERTDR